MTRVNVRVVSYRDRPELDDTWDEVVGPAWPEFMLHDATVNEHWGLLYEEFPDCQLYLVDTSTDEVLAQANAVPLRWDGTAEDLPDDGVDGILRRVATEQVGRATPTSLCALQAVVKRGFRRRGLSGRVIDGMAEIALAHGLADLIAPVRPNEKPRYPLTPIERYVAWTRDDGLPSDPWLRVHTRLGAEIVKLAPRSMTIAGTVAEWEQWTGIPFPESGIYIVPDALVPVEIDRESDRGTYIEPNVWMRHRLSD